MKKHNLQWTRNVLFILTEKNKTTNQKLEQYYNYRAREN